MAAAGLGQICIPDDASAHPRKLSLALDGFLVHPQSEEQVMGGWRERGVTVMLQVVTVWHFSTSSSSNFSRS